MRNRRRNFVEHVGGVVVGIVARDSEPYHVDRALVHVFLRDEIVAGLGRVIVNFILRQRRPFGPLVECGAEPGFHCGGIEIAANAKNNVVGMNVLAVPFDQVLARDGRNGRVLGTRA